MLRILSLILIAVGGAIMGTTIARYHQLLRYNQQETYATQMRNRTSEAVSLALLYVFAIGFIVGAVDMALHDVSPMFAFVILIFFLGSVFIHNAVENQHTMARSLRQKTLETMKTFVNAIDLKDAYTKGHSIHLYEIVRLFYDQLKDDYKLQLNEPKLLDAALLHDIGMISVKDEILGKQGALNDEEWKAIKSHPATGKRMLDDTCFCDISNWVLYHHERVDGKGYYGLKGEEIPLESRIIAIAETYSALCTDRVYRRMLSHKQAVKILREVSGTQLDERLLVYFFRIDGDELSRLVA